jgi:hypothetical protein
MTLAAGLSPRSGGSTRIPGVALAATFRDHTEVGNDSGCTRARKNRLERRENAGRRKDDRWLAPNDYQQTVSSDHPFTFAHRTAIPPLTLLAQVRRTHLGRLRMNTARSLGAIAAALVLLGGCGGEDPAGPDVRGMTLPDAKKALKTADVRASVHSDALFGVIVEENFVVCDQEAVNARMVRLEVSKYDC